MMAHGNDVQTIIERSCHSSLVHSTEFMFAISYSTLNNFWWQRKYQ